jgi:hypothetical protein
MRSGDHDGGKNAAIKQWNAMPRRLADGSAGTLASRIKTLASLRLPDAQIEGALDDLTMGNLLRWYDAGCGSGSHLAKALSLPPSRNIRALANILTCAKESREVKGMLAALAE